MTNRAITSFVDQTPGEPPVSGMLHSVSSAGDFLVLTHGASGNMKAALLVALADELASAGINVLRCDLPYRQRRPHGPPSPANAKEDQEGLRRALTLMKGHFAGRAFLGGSSYGGRQASLLVASDPGVVEGLLLLSYPLHPPGKPAQLRIAHFPSLRIPTLFVSGTKDSFGTIEELKAAIGLITVRTELVTIDGAPHGLAKSSEKVAAVTAQKFLDFVG